MARSGGKKSPRVIVIGCGLALETIIRENGADRLHVTVRPRATYAQQQQAQLDKVAFSSQNARFWPLNERLKRV
jgi:hypothetical protein